MGRVVAGLLVIGVLAVLFLVVAVQRGGVFAQSPEVVLPSSGQGLLALSATKGDELQQVTVIDPKNEVLAVYHIDFATGRAQLKSVRKIHWDLLIQEFEGLTPLPREIRALLEQR